MVPMLLKIDREHLYQENLQALWRMAFIILGDKNHVKQEAFVI